jgi:hypothetical protein
LGDDENITVVSPPDVGTGGQFEDQILHLVQDEETIAELHRVFSHPMSIMITRGDMENLVAEC